MFEKSGSLFMDKGVLPLIRVGGIAVLLKIYFLVFGIVIILAFGNIPTSVMEYFTVMHENSLIGIMRSDFSNLLLITMYLFSFTALFVIVSQTRFSMAFIATLLTYIAVILCIQSHSAFSLMYLSERYFSTTDVLIKQQLLTAGEAVIARNMWNTTGAFFSGIFLQGSGVLISIAMINNKNFSKITVISGIAANGLDLVNHLVHYAYPYAAMMLIRIAGPVYIIWYLMLAKELFGYARKEKLNLLKMNG